jgi:hypothetical protein
VTVKDYSWATHSSKNSTVVHSGKFSFSFLPRNNAAAYLFCSGCISTESVKKTIKKINYGNSIPGLNFGLMLVRAEVRELICV